MNSAAIEIEDHTNNVATLATYQPPLGPGESWIDTVMQSMANNGIKKKLSNAAKVHPCIIDGNRVLVYQKGLKQREPDAFTDLLEFAEKNNFALKEDRRDINNIGIPFERRKAKTTSMVLLAGGLFLHGAAQAGAIPKNQIDDLVLKDHVFPMVQVMDEQQGKSRSYLARDGKQTPIGVTGEIENILSIAGQIKAKGSMTGVSTHNVNMPGEYVGGFIHRYDYQFPHTDGVVKYSYYEGEGFGALGYYNNDQVMLDVLIGSEKDASPVLGGPYDQLLYDNHQMQLISYKSKSNKQTSFLKASYSIGITAIISL